MNKITARTAAFATWAVLAFVFGVTSAVAQPTLKLVSGDVHDWGKVTPATPKLSASIKIMNTGTEELVIKKPTTSCGCTAAEPEKSSLKPGESTMLSITMDITGKSGEVSKTVTIPSNDPVSPQTVLTVKANIYSPLEVNPRMFALNQLEIGKKSSVKLEVKNTSNHVITIKAGDSFKMKLKITKPIKLKPGKTTEIEAFITPEEKGTLTAGITLVTDDKDMPTVSIKGYCNVVK